MPKYLSYIFINKSIFLRVFPMGVSIAMGFNCSWAFQWTDLRNIYVCIYTSMSLGDHQLIPQPSPPHRCPSHPTQTLVPLVGSPPACVFPSSSLAVDTPHWATFLHRCSSPLLGSDTPHRPVLLCVALPSSSNIHRLGYHCCLLT